MDMNSVDFARARLRKAAADLAMCDELRKELMVSRDLALVAAREAGVKWRELQSDANLSVGAVRSILKAQD